MILISFLIFFVAFMEVSNFTDFRGDFGPVDVKNFSYVIIYAFSGLGFLVGGSIIASTDNEKT